MIEILSESGEYEKIDCIVGDVDFCSSFYDSSQSVEHLAKTFDRLVGYYGKFTLDDKSIASWWRAVKEYDRKTYDNLSLSEKVKAKRIMRAQDGI